MAEGYPHAWKGAQNGSGADGCIGLPPGRYAAGFLFVSASERLANATICRFCGCFLSQMGEAPGGTKGYALLIEGRGRIPNGSWLFDLVGSSYAAATFGRWPAA